MDLTGGCTGDAGARITSPPLLSISEQFVLLAAFTVLFLSEIVTLLTLLVLILLLVVFSKRSGLQVLDFISVLAVDASISLVFEEVRREWGGEVGGH